MDKSSSIGAANFNKERTFVKSLLAKLDIGLDKTRVAIIEFNRNYKILTDLKTGISRSELDKQIDSILYTDTYGTDTAQALRVANDQLLKTSRGMRDKNVPKVVLTITDGRSKSAKETESQAKRIKARNINMVSVGIAQARVSELLTLATTGSDQYYVSDFNKVLTIVNDLSRTTCRQPVDVDEVDETRASVGKDAYRYFRFSLNADKGTGLVAAREMTIELDELEGAAEVFFSFEDANPKRESDYWSEDDSGKDENYRESGEVVLDGKVMAGVNMAVRSGTGGGRNATRYYRVSNPEGKSPLFIGVRGGEARNEFRLAISNLTVGRWFKDLGD